MIWMSRIMNITNRFHQNKAKVHQAHLKFMVKFWQKKTSRIYNLFGVISLFAKILLRIRFSKGCLMCGAIFVHQQGPTVRMHFFADFTVVRGQTQMVVEQPIWGTKTHLTLSNRIFSILKQGMRDVWTMSQKQSFIKAKSHHTRQFVVQSSVLLRSS